LADDPEETRKKRTEANRQIVSQVTRKAILTAVHRAKPDVSRERVSALADKIEVKTREVMDACGLTDHELINRHLRPALDAMETRFFPMATDDDPTHIEERQTVAWNPRLRALDVAFQLRGSYPPRNANLEIGVEFSLADEVRKARARVLVRSNTEGNNDRLGE
jgi:hypothetical protein